MNTFVVGMYEKIPAEAISVNTTSKSNHWSRDLSPFYLGPVDLYGDFRSRNMENGWQFYKVYPEHADNNGEPTQDYWLWAQKGWNDSFAHRYPMGKGRKPLYSFWKQKKLTYIPLYATAVAKTNGFAQLQELCRGERDLYLRDFDGYNHRKLGMSYQEVMNCPSKKMGHAFVLSMMLEACLPKE